MTFQLDSTFHAVHDFVQHPFGKTKSKCLCLVENQSVQLDHDGGGVLKRVVVKPVWNLDQTFTYTIVMMDVSDRSCSFYITSESYFSDVFLLKCTIAEQKNVEWFGIQRRRHYMDFIRTIRMCTRFVSAGLNLYWNGRCTFEKQTPSTTEVVETFGSEPFCKWTVERLKRESMISTIGIEVFQISFKIFEENDVE